MTEVNRNVVHTEFGRHSDEESGFVPRRRIVTCSVDSIELNKPTPLMTDEIRQRLPKLYATANDDNPVVQVRYRAWKVCDWNAIEFDGEDIFFGLVWQSFPVWGYFRLSDLQTMNDWNGAPAIVVDRFFEPRPVTHTVLDYSTDI